MKYKITITKIEETTVTKRGEYTIIDKRPWTQEELTAGIIAANFLEKTPLKEIRGYAPSVESVEVNELEVFKQVVEELHLAAVITAVNGL